MWFGCIQRGSEKVESSGDQKRSDPTADHLEIQLRFNRLGPPLKLEQWANFI